MRVRENSDERDYCVQEDFLKGSRKLQDAKKHVRRLLPSFSSFRDADSVFHEQETILEVSRYAPCPGRRAGADLLDSLTRSTTTSSHTRSLSATQQYIHAKRERSV